MTLLVIGLIMAVVGQFALIAAVCYIGHQVAREKFWQGAAFLASAAAIFMFFGLMIAASGSHAM